MLQIPDFIALMHSVCMQFGYVGVLVMSLAGALSIFVPVPDTIAVFTLAGLKVGVSWVFEPLLLALSASIGGAIGNFVGYLLGVSSGRVITGKFRNNVDFLVKVFDKFGAFAIFALALTPLPDDLVFIPLGAKRYNPIKALASAMFGKFLLCLVVAYGARLSVSLIVNIIGAGTGSVSLLASVTSGVVLTFALFKVDGARRFEKYIDKTNVRPMYVASSLFSQKELQLKIAAVMSNLTLETKLFGRNKISPMSLCLERVALR